MGVRERRASEYQEAEIDFKAYFGTLPLDDVVRALEVTKTTITLGWLKPESDRHLAIELYRTGIIPGTDSLMMGSDKASVLQKFYRTRPDKCDAVIIKWNEDINHG